MPNSQSRSHNREIGSDSQDKPKSRESDSETRVNPSELLDRLNISSDPTIACMTVPMVLGLVGGKAIADALQSLGEASEEIFRGDRLPVLHFPAAPDSDRTPPET